MSAAPYLSQPDSWSLFSLAGLENGDVDSYFDRLLERVAGHFTANGATLFLAQRSGNAYVLRSKSGTHSTVPEGAKVMVGDGIAGRVLSSRVPRILGELSVELGFQDLAPSSRAAIASSMIVPLLDPSGGLVGVLNVSRGADQPPFSDVDLNIANGIASLVTLALTNATLVEHFVHRTRQALASEEKLQAVFDSVDSAILVFDRHNNVLERNEAALNLVSQTSDAWHESKEIVSVFPRLLRGAQEKKGAYTEKVAGKNNKSWIVTATPLSAGGTVLTVVDISDAEQSVRESERLLRLAEIGQMTAALAHEIRNPLTGIRSAAQMIQQDPESSQDYLGVIIEESMRLNVLCDEFLAFAKPQEISIHETCLSEVIERVMIVQKCDFVKANVELSFENRFPDTVVQIDRSKIEQVIHNLLRNARQACGQMGSVHIRTHKAGFSVTDDGIGMTTVQTDRLFTPFFTTKSNGMGLGLCTVKNILDAHEAKIEVDSKPGRGSTFNVTFQVGGS